MSCTGQERFRNAATTLAEGRIRVLEMGPFLMSKRPLGEHLRRRRG